MTATDTMARGGIDTVLGSADTHPAWRLAFAKPPSEKKYAVIGAGAAGICAAKYLLEVGLDVTVFEIGTQIGGLWVYENDSGRSSAYKTLHINSAKNLTNYSDFKFKDSVQRFPSHWDMHEYLDDYARHFGVRDRILFRTEVTAVEPRFTPGEEAPRWDITTVDGQVRTFDVVMVATGHLTRPLHVPEFQDDFAGEYLHSHYYRTPEPYKGKRVCIVGVGNSAVDIASDICVITKDCVIVARSGVSIAPKLIFGYPVTDISMKLYQPWIPDRLRRWILSKITEAIHGRMEDYGFKPMTRRAHPTTSGTVIQDIAYNRVRVKQGISRIEGNRIHFVDGTSDEFDVLLGCTGYLIDLPFLSSDVVPIVDNNVDLYKRILPVDWPGLYFIGMVMSTTALNWNYEEQSRWIREFEFGRAVLPPRDEMVADMERKKSWVRSHYKESPRHHIEEEHMYYFMELHKSLRKGRLRRWRERLGGVLGRGRAGA
jgi:dimethylaniline monooxygenase (N-oxide forming)